MPKGKLNIKKADMPKFLASAELADVVVDGEESREVGSYIRNSITFKSTQQIFDIATYMQDMEDAE